MGQNKNIIKLYNSGTANFVYQEGWSKEVDFIVLSYEAGGDLLGCIQETGRLSEDVSRYYFKQLLAGL